MITDIIGFPHLTPPFDTTTAEIKRLVYPHTTGDLAAPTTEFPCYYTTGNQRVFTMNGLPWLEGPVGLNGIILCRGTVGSSRYNKTGVWRAGARFYGYSSGAYGFPASYYFLPNASQVRLLSGSLNPAYPAYVEVAIHWDTARLVWRVDGNEVATYEILDKVNLEVWLGQSTGRSYQTPCCFNDGYIVIDNEQYPNNQTGRFLGKIKVQALPVSSVTDAGTAVGDTAAAVLSTQVNNGNKLTRYVETKTRNIPATISFNADALAAAHIGAATVIVGVTCAPDASTMAHANAKARGITIEAGQVQPGSSTLSTLIMPIPTQNDRLTVSELNALTLNVWSSV